MKRHPTSAPETNYEKKGKALNYPIKGEWPSTGDYDYNGDSDYEESYLNQNLPEWKQVIDDFRRPNQIPILELVKMVLTMAPAVLHACYFALLSANLAVALARASIVIFSVLLVVRLYHLTKWTNEDSISGMVAQRNLKPSYITILLIQGVSYLVVGMFLISLVVITSKTETNNWIIASFVLGLVSPVFSSAILLFPLVVFKGFEETCTIPIGKRVISNKYRIKFYKSLNTEAHRKRHIGVILAGVVSGWLALVFSLIGNGIVDWNSRISIVYLCVSAWGIYNFLTFKPEEQAADFLKLEVLRKLLKEPPNTWAKRGSIFLEFVGLYYYLAALCMVFVLNYKLIEIR